MTTSSWQRNHKENYFHQGDGMKVAFTSFGISFSVLLMGFLYYVVRSQAQYVRLRTQSEGGYMPTGESGLLA